MGSPRYRRGLGRPPQSSPHRRPPAKLAKLRGIGQIVVDEAGYIRLEQDAANLFFIVWPAGSTSLGELVAQPVVELPDVVLARHQDAAVAVDP